MLHLAPLTDFDVGAAAAALIGFIAYRVRSLDGGGAVAAFIVGTATFGSLGFPGAAVLLAFFVSSVALSRIGKARKAAVLVDIGKTAARDAAQVLANGGVAAACALATLILGPRYAFAFAGALAAATADTWGTEIGSLARRSPRSIVTWQPIAPGLSGGVTWLGTLAEVAGAAALAAVALTLNRRAFGAVAVAGITGALVDSLLGASLQNLRWCPNCRRPTELEPHTCGANTTSLRGVTWFGNDAVNFSATLAGAAVGFALAPS